MRQVTFSMTGALLLVALGVTVGIALAEPWIAILISALVIVTVAVAFIVQQRRGRVMAIGIGDVLLGMLVVGVGFGTSLSIGLTSSFGTISGETIGVAIATIFFFGALIYMMVSGAKKGRR